ncbi:leucine-tRNA ligase [Dacryopinax primogenitus]|uniref:leucine--tRNA ligase n=1 Tax=Dacryopinax primogenitus (strain DJM 731) TaxID=1858805 RepID=M5GEG8_DACPD|nr:leucine-tRNA ligase [Dacryopinax primogenitus]EJU03238.1 leucine-tRNA ligase [Dacryopinax primogenitus]
MAASNGPIELAKTGKRDYLVALEKKYQAQWADQKLFEAHPPAPGESEQEKWMGTFPFAYMNGSYHLGHAFTISKIEFDAGFQRMLGKRVLFPMGFHCTGMPIKAAADKLIREMELFGADFEHFAPETEDGEAIHPPVEPNPPASIDKAKKGKVAAKATGLTYQFQIMESIGVPREEIKRFADPYHWLGYFPPIAIEDAKSFGARIDYRRSFITTDVNPYFDSFVRWQMNKLHGMQKVQFGERYTIYSPKDGQPCMDHDRASGEALGPQEYTALRMQVVSLPPAAQVLHDKAGGRTIYLVAATLRPETMYGQTNCFVGTAIKYGLFVANDKEAYVCTYRAARNMAFQGCTLPRGEVTQLAEVDGAVLVGARIKAPFGINPEVYVLPMENVLATKGTGVVTSVPSDSPDDYQTLMDLRKKAEFYKIDPSWAALEPIPVINTPTYGDLTAPTLCKQLKIQSQKDVKQLAEAKELAYKEGFYSGTMLVGEFKGEPVQEAKGKVREKMIEASLAFAYAEPEGLIISRSADECVVALVDQWYIDYGEPVWKEQAEKLLGKMNTYFDETRHAFQGTLSWLNKWACARTYGLGSKLPWDQKWLVESLSDSTIYMAYYTVAYLLQGGVIDGHKVGPLGVKAEQMTDEVWEHILCDGPYPEQCPISKEQITTMKREFNYWYPMDIRSSGKDLINNHLTFCIYNHAAIFPEEKWPLSMRANGHLMLNGKKMSKSTGNSLTMRDSIQKFGADATRVALADAGDGIEDANFEETTANAAILRLHTLMTWCEEMVETKSTLRTGPKTFHDDVFENEINNLIEITKKNYDATSFKDALKYGFYELQSARDAYREMTADANMHADLVEYFIRISALLVCPIAPHFSEHLWTIVLKEPKSVQVALYPAPSKPVHHTLLDAAAYFRDTVKAIRDAEMSLGKRKGKSTAPVVDPSKPKALRIFVASAFPQWQDACVKAVKDSFDGTTGTVDDAKVRQLLGAAGLMKEKRAMPFVQAFKKRIGQFGAKTAFNRTLPFHEMDVLQANLPYLQRTFNCEKVDIELADEARAKAGQPTYSAAVIDTAEPGSPSFTFYNI